MNYYAVQVQTNQEEKIISKATKELCNREKQLKFIFPKRLLKIRKQSITKNELKPIFPGYLFIETESIDHTFYQTIRSIHGFIRFLNSNNDIVALSGKDLAILEHFMQFGNIITSSTVYFDENDRIVVSEGPLKGLEGLIIKVDKRKHRAKVKMDFANDSILLDLAFDVLEQGKKDDD